VGGLYQLPRSRQVSHERAKEGHQQWDERLQGSQWPKDVKSDVAGLRCGNRVRMLIDVSQMNQGMWRHGVSRRGSLVEVLLPVV
jgi:hypothetical protein